MIYISIVVQLSRKIIKHFYNEPVYVADGGETMAYSELIKNFNKIRDYMRDFYVYGFKSRDDYTKKSARSYDDEKRRIESWLGEYMKFHQTADGKNVFLSIDSRVTRHNPLYKAWKTKSFTDGSLVAIVSQVDQYLSAFDHARVFDISTIRKKLNEYVKEGLLVSRKNGKMMLYRRTEELEMPGTDVLDFFSETAPCGAQGGRKGVYPFYSRRWDPYSGRFPHASSGRR